MGIVLSPADSWQSQGEVFLSLHSTPCTVLGARSRVLGATLCREHTPLEPWHSQPPTGATGATSSSGVASHEDAVIAATSHPGHRLEQVRWLGVRLG